MQITNNPALTWKVEDKTPATLVVFNGEIDENADFSDLRRVLRGAVQFELKDITRINSCGVREWVNFVRDIPNVTDLTFTHCSPAIVTQLNMIYNFRGPARVASFYAPYVCELCHHEEEKLLEIEQEFPEGTVEKIPEFRCGNCSRVMEFDDIPDRYFSFLTEA